MDRIQNTDLAKTLREIAVTNTVTHLENDFEISLNRMMLSAKMDDPTEKTLIWVSYPSGIDCYPERDVFLKDTSGYNGVVYHGEGKQEIRLAYAVEVSAVKDGKPFGTIDEINIRDYAEQAKSKAVPSEYARIYVDDIRDYSKQIVMPLKQFNDSYPNNLPKKMIYYRYEPADQRDLYAALVDTQKSRCETADLSDMWSHTNKLYDNRYVFHADRLLEELDKHEKPNSSDDLSFTTPLDGLVAKGYSAEELSKILDRLPFKNPIFTVSKGSWDMKLVVSRDDVEQYRREQQVQRAAVKDGNGIPSAAQKEKNIAAARKPSLMASLEAGEKKSKEEYGDKSEHGVEIPQKGSKKNGLEDF
jgi:hypothetical protein